MNQHCTIAYVTCRENPCAFWFFDSLRRQIKPEDNISLVVVDFYKGIHVDRDGWLERMESVSKDLIWSEPKPCVWSGPHRLTSKDYFSASNARNTALCYAKDGWIAYVDDLSVLMPTWLQSVRDAMAGNYIALGTYEKVDNLQVENGVIMSYDKSQGGADSRLSQAKGDLTSAAGSWMFGCSVAMPVQALIDVNGWDENCDSTGLGTEDYCLGIRIGNTNKYSFRYDTRMKTLEDGPLHHIGKSMRRDGKGFGKDTKGHRMLNMALHSKWAPNYFGEGGIDDLRQKILAGEFFPIQSIPQHDWFDGQPLSEL